MKHEPIISPAKHEFAMEKAGRYSISHCAFAYEKEIVMEVAIVILKILVSAGVVAGVVDFILKRRLSKLDADLKTTIEKTMVEFKWRHEKQRSLEEQIMKLIVETQATFSDVTLIILSEWRQWKLDQLKGQATSLELNTAISDAKQQAREALRNLEMFLKMHAGHLDITILEIAQQLEAYHKNTYSIMFSSPTFVVTKADHKGKPMLVELTRNDEVLCRLMEARIIENTLVKAIRANDND